MTQAPPGRPPEDVFSLGILGAPDELIGIMGALRNHRRERQWYLGLLLIDPAMRGKGRGSAALVSAPAYRASRRNSEARFCVPPSRK